MVYVYIESEDWPKPRFFVCIGQEELDPQPVIAYTTSEEGKATAQAQILADKLRACGVEVKLH